MSCPVEACMYLLAQLHTPRTCDILGQFPTLRADLGYQCDTHDSMTKSDIYYNTTVPIKVWCEAGGG